MSSSASAAGNAIPLAASTTNTEAAAEAGMKDAVDSNVAASAVQAQQKYASERDKRLRPDGISQYVDLSKSDKFKHYEADPWIDPNASEVGSQVLTDGSRCKNLIVGAGFGGLLFAVRLIQAGIAVEDIRIVDSAGGFGGTWYWSRYPGIMCDIESYIYMPLLEEMNYMPKHKYAYGPELRAYANNIAEKWKLKDVAQFQMNLKGMTWDDNEKEWVVEMHSRRASQTQDPDITVRAQFVMVVSGVLNKPKLPDLPGLDSFQGHIFHTSRFDYAYTGGSPEKQDMVNLKDKKVGVIGTGATAVQMVPELAKWAKELYIFQRTPSSVDRRDNRPTDPEWWKHEVDIKKGWQRERMENFNAHISHVSPLPKVNMVDDQWSKLPAYHALVGAPNEVTMESIPQHIGYLHSVDFPRTERVRSRVNEIVKDKVIAESLKAWYPTWCKRPCFHDEYLQSFNLPNVKLIDTDGKGVDYLTEHGLKVGEKEFELDLIIMSTGFASPFEGKGCPSTRAGIFVKGRNQTLDEKWTSSVGTLHGVVSNGFPNLFFPGPIQAGAGANQMYTLDQLSTHVAYILSEAAKKSKAEKFTIEPTIEAEEAWSMQIMSQAAAFAGLAGCTPSYLNAEGEADRISGLEEQMKAARGSIWGRGIGDYVSVIEAWRNKGNLGGLTVEVAA